MCEPQLGKRGMYPTLSRKNTYQDADKILDFLMYSDGTNSLEKISNLIKLELVFVKKINKILLKNNLIVNL